MNDYVVLVNAERKGTVDLLLASTPERISMHWDAVRRRSLVCAGKAMGCSWCQQEQVLRVCHYARCLLCEYDGEREQNVMRPGLVMLPMGFVASRHDQLVPGRWIKVFNLHVPDKRPGWTTGKLTTQPLPEAVQFDVRGVLLRITGQTPANTDKPEENPSILKFRRA